MALYIIFFIALAITIFCGGEIIYKLTVALQYELRGITVNGITAVVIVRTIIISAVWTLFYYILNNP